jgi:hypothetical protein
VDAEVAVVHQRLQHAIGQVADTEGQRRAIVDQARCMPGNRLIGFGGWGALAAQRRGRAAGSHHQRGLDVRGQFSAGHAGPVFVDLQDHDPRPACRRQRVVDVQAEEEAPLGVGAACR